MNNFKPKDLADGLKHIQNAFQEALRHKILNDLAAVITGDVSARVGIKFPPATGKIVNPTDIKFSIIYTGELTDEQKFKVREVMQKYSTAARLGG